MCIQRPPSASASRLSVPAAWMDEPASAEEGRQARFQAAVMGFYGLILLLPIEDGYGVRLAGQLLLIWLMFALNLLGPRSIARFQSMCVIFGLLPIMVLTGLTSQGI